MRIISLLAMFWWVYSVQVEPAPTAFVTVCEVLQDLGAYNGKVIQVRGEWAGNGNLTFDCPVLKTGKYKWSNALYLAFPPDDPDFFIGPPADWTVPDSDLYNSIHENAWQEWDRLPNSTKKTTTVMATAIGRLDARLPLHLDALGQPAGYGHLDVLPARVVLIEIRDVRVSSVKRRVAGPPLHFRFSGRLDQ